MSKVSVARVPTGSASRYLQQLAKHWSHKMAVSYTEAAATIVFPNGSRLDLAADGDHLAVTLMVAEGQDVAQMRGVVASHLDRFAFREAPLHFDWYAG